MDYEKKLALAKEALDTGSYDKETIEYIFPELKESEYERIRKGLIEYFLHYPDHEITYYDLKSDSVIAWLEKQGEQKTILPWKYKKDNTPLLRDSLILNKYGCVAKSPSGALVSDVWVMDYDELAKLPKEEIEKQVVQKPADKVEPKFKVGDWVVNEFGHLKHIIKIKNDCYYAEGESVEWHGTFEYGDTHFRLWTIQDAKDGDLIYISTEEKGVQAIFHEYKNNTVFFHCYLCMDFQQGGYMPIGSVELVYPLQKEHYKRFFAAMHEAGYEWDAEKKESKKIEQKEDMYNKLTDFEVSLKHVMEEAIECGDTHNLKADADMLLRIAQKPAVWSKEDESLRLRTIGALVTCKIGSPTKCVDEQINWLKSLKPQSQWRPSDEQMKALDDVISSRDVKYDVLSELWKDLNKLK